MLQTGILLLVAFFCFLLLVTGMNSYMTKSEPIMVSQSLVFLRRRAQDIVQSQQTFSLDLGFLVQSERAGLLVPVIVKLQGFESEAMNGDVCVSSSLMETDTQGGSDRTCRFLRSLATLGISFRLENCLLELLRGRIPFQSSNVQDIC